MKLGEVLKGWRTKQEIGVRAAAKDIGLDPTTLNRIERGKVPDTRTLIRIWHWLIDDDLPEEEA